MDNSPIVRHLRLPRERERERYFINHHCSHRLNYEIFTNIDDNKRENKKNFLHLIDMAKNKTVLQTLGFTSGESEITFASQCIFTTLPLGEEAMEIVGGVTEDLVKQID